MSVFFLAFTQTEHVRPSLPSCTWGWCLSESDPRTVCTYSWGTPSPSTWSRALSNWLNTKTEGFLFYSSSTWGCYQPQNINRKLLQIFKAIKVLNDNGWVVLPAVQLQNNTNLAEGCLIQGSHQSWRCRQCSWFRWRWQLAAPCGGDTEEWHTEWSKKNSESFCIGRKKKLLAPDVLPVHRLKKLMTFDLLHTHCSNPVLSISAIP